MIKLALVVGALLLAGCSSKKEVPIVTTIGLPAVVDQKEERQRAVVRNLIYENPGKEDPEFYAKIVAKVEAYAKTRNLQRSTTMNPSMEDKFGLDGSIFKESDIVEKVAFFASEGGFKCIVCNGGHFVLLVLEANY